MPVCRSLDSRLTDPRSSTQSAEGTGRPQFYKSDLLSVGVSSRAPTIVRARQVLQFSTLQNYLSGHHEHAGANKCHTPRGVVHTGYTGDGQPAAPQRRYCVGGGPTLLMSTLPMKKGKASTARARGTRTTAEAVMPGRRKKVSGSWGGESALPTRHHHACTEPPRAWGSPTLAGAGQPSGAAVRRCGGVRRPPCRVWVPSLWRLLPPGAHADVEAVHLLGLVLARHAACPRRGSNA